MRKFNFKIKIVTTAVLVVSSLTLVAVGFGHYSKLAPKKQIEKKPRPDTLQAPACNPALLARMIKTARSLDFNQPDCTYRGMIDMTDENDTANSSHQLPFLFCRSGGRYYYLLGNNEVIHQDSLNIFIQNEQHKVVLSSQAIRINPPVIDLAAMGKSLQSEGYTLTSRLKGSHQTLSIINEEHLSIKEVTVSLDTVSKKLERIYIRQTDFGSPQDKHLDRVTDVRITEIQDRAVINQYPGPGGVIQRKNGHWELTNKYKDYELILL